MKLRVAILLAAALSVSACGTIRESRLNPFNWFGKSEEKTTAAGPIGATTDQRGLVEEVIGMEIARHAGGAIVYATGLPPSQGWWNAELVAENGGVPENGVLTYRFVVFPPVKPGNVSTQRSRELTAAAYLSDAKLADIKQIVVVGLKNSRSSRR